MVRLIRNIAHTVSMTMSEERVDKVMFNKVEGTNSFYSITVMLNFTIKKSQTTWTLPLKYNHNTGITGKYNTVTHTS